MKEDLYFSEEHIMLRDMVREFAQNEVKPLAQKLDETGEFPHESVKKMANLGLMGIPWEEKYGGTGMDTLALVIAIEELGKECCSTAATLMAHTSLGTAPIVMYGTEEQKEKYLPGLASGEKIGAFGLTEPNAGSDAGNTKTRAVLDGDHYTVNGEKAFCTNAGVSSVLIFTAVIVENGKENGISAFVVKSDTEGISFNPPEKKMGWCASDTRSIFFNDMCIPKSAILGNPEKGFKQFLQTLTSGRITIGALSIGTAQGAFNRALAYSQEREAFGRPIAKFQNTRFKLAEMLSEIQMGRIFIDKCIELHLKQELDVPTAAMAKYTMTELQCKVVDECVQLHGGYGYMWEFWIARAYVDSRAQRIYAGTNEIMKEIISRSIFQ